MSIEQQFKAAVNVIRNLPPKGSVQPSNTTKLKFYAYYKQATEGPNTTTKPSFWDPVKRAKWEAWSRLGQLDRESAMQKYVDEFKKVSESVASSNAGNMDKSEIDSFYSSIPVNDLELLIPQITSSSRSNSPTTIKDGRKTAEEVMAMAKSYLDNKENNRKDDKDVKSKQKNTSSNSVYVNGSVNGEEDDDDDEDDDFFLDTIENYDQANTKYKDGNINNYQLPYTNGYAVCVSDERNNNGGRYLNDGDLRKVIVCLQKDLEKVAKSVDLIEQRIGQLQGKIIQRKWKYPILPPLTTFIVLFSWPIILQLLMYWLRRRRG